MRRRDLLKAIPLLMTPSLARADTLPLRFIPNANLTSLDPIWTTALVAQAHGYLVYDTLYGIDASNKLQPQMCAGHDISADELTWTFTLRDGLAFHDGEKVLAKDCVMSLKRWASRNSFGQQLTRVANEIVAVDDRRFQIRLKKPFRQMLYGFGARSCFMMPERMAKTPASEQVKETIGSGPFRFLPGEWVSGAHAGYSRFDGYVPRQEPPSFYAGGKVAHFERVEWIVQPDSATAAAALQKGEVDWVEQPLIDLCPMLRTSPDVVVAVNDPFGWQPIIALNHLTTPFDNPKLRRALLPALDQKAFITAVIGEQAELGRVPGGYFADGQPMASHVGLEVLTRPRDLALAKRLVAEAGYSGEKIVLLSASDRPVYSQVSLVARDLFQKTRPDRGLPSDGLGYGGHAADQPEPDGQGRLERFHHCLGWRHRDQSRRQLRVAGQRPEGLVRLADGRKVGRTARCLVRRPRPGVTKGTRRADPASRAWKPCPTSRSARCFSRPRSARTSRTL